jgi:hypothetical protein
VVVQRREVWWADLDEPRGSEPGFRRPLLVVQADAFNRSRLRTVLGVVLTSNMRLLRANRCGLAPDVATSRDSSSSPKPEKLILDTAGRDRAVSGSGVRYRSNELPHVPVERGRGLHVREMAHVSNHPEFRVRDLRTEIACDLKR